MAGPNIELVITADNSQANTAIKQTNAGLSSFERSGLSATKNVSGGLDTFARTAKSSTDKASKGFDGLVVAMTKGIIAAHAVRAAFQQVTSVLQGLTVGSALYAAQTETLNVVVGNMAATNGLVANRAKEVVQSVRAQGIALKESQTAVSRMISANLDLAHATNLARGAQDLAASTVDTRTGQLINSSEALERIIHGIVSGETEVLRTLGVLVNFQKSYLEQQRRINRELTEQEKVNIRLAETMEFLTRFTGNYETAMGTAGKQLTSLRRLFDEAKEAIGQGFLLQVKATVAALTELAKWARENGPIISDVIKNIAISVGALTAAFVILKTTANGALFTQLAASALAFHRATAALRLSTIALIGVQAALAASSRALSAVWLFASSPAGWITLAVIGITTLIFKIRELKQLQAEATQQQEDQAKDVARATGSVQQMLALLKSRGELNSELIGQMQKQGPTGEIFKRLLADTGDRAFLQTQELVNAQQRQIDQLNSLRAKRALLAQAGLSLTDDEANQLRGLEAAGTRPLTDAAERVRLAAEVRKEQFSNLIAAGISELKNVQQESSELQEAIAKAAKEGLRESQDFLRGAIEGQFSPIQKLFAEAAAEIEKLSEFKIGDEIRRREITAQERLNIETALHIKIRALNEETIQRAVQDSERWKDAAKQHVEELSNYRVERYADTLNKQFDLENSIDGQIRDLMVQRIAFQEELAGRERDTRLRQLDLESIGAETIQQKVALESRRADIEIQYIEQVHRAKLSLFDLETAQLVGQAKLQRDILAASGVNVENINASIAELERLRGAIRGGLDSGLDDARRAVVERTAIRQAEIIHNHYREVFDSVKQQAGDVFDALLDKSKSVWEQIGNLFKTTILTAIKDTFTEAIATFLTPFLARVRDVFAQARGGFQTGGTFGGGPVNGNPVILSLGTAALAPLLSPMTSATTEAVQATTGATQAVTAATQANSQAVAISTNVAAQSVSILESLKQFIGLGVGSNGAAPSGVGGTIGAVASSPAAGLAGLGLLSSGLSGNKSTASAGTQSVAGGALLGASLSTALGTSALWAGVLGAGVGLAAAGIKQGGVAGLGLTTAGGALIGLQLGGPIGAAIGAGIGFTVGLFGLWRKSAEKKMAEKIKQMYGVTVHDKGLLKSFVEIAKSQFGGNMDLALASPQVRETIKLYAMTTGQKGTFPRTGGPVSLVQSGGSLFQAPSFENGVAQTSLGGSIPAQAIMVKPELLAVSTQPLSVERVAAPQAQTQSQEVHFSVDNPVIVDGQVIENRVRKFVLRNGRMMSESTLSGVRASSSRRELTTAQMQPGLITT